MNLYNGSVSIAKFRLSERTGLTITTQDSDGHSRQLFIQADDVTAFLTRLNEFVRHARAEDDLEG